MTRLCLPVAGNEVEDRRQKRFPLRMERRLGCYFAAKHCFCKAIFRAGTNNIVKTIQYKTRQDKTRQDKTRPEDKTGRQDKTR